MIPCAGANERTSNSASPPARRERLCEEDSYVARQGRSVGRDGRVEVRFGEAGAIWVGGQAVTCVEGMLET